MLGAAKATSGGAAWDRLAGWQPTGSKPMDIWVDRASRLVVGFVDNTGPAPMTGRLSDFRTVDGVKVPFHISVGDGDPAHSQELQVASIVIEPIPRAAFDPPAGQ